MSLKLLGPDDTRSSTTELTAAHELQSRSQQPSGTPSGRGPSSAEPSPSRTRRFQRV